MRHFSPFIWYSVSDRTEAYIHVYLDSAYLSFIEPIKSVSEVDKCIVNTGVVGQGQKGVILSHGRDGAQSSLPTLVIPVDKL